MPAVYIHIPFCRRRCNYCDFCSSIHSSETAAAYVDALVRNIRAYSRLSLEADTVYIGGGTPSLLTPREMSRILDALRESFSLSDGAEITAEANPDTADYDKLSAWHDCGVNRVSFGIQSCKDSELYTLGRLHTFTQAAEAVRSARLAGIENISCDLMLGIPGQTLKTAEESVNAVCDLEIKHLSAYMLKVESGTPFDRPEIISSLPTDDETADIYLMAAETAENRGLMQYEISNFAAPGYQSRHNLKYWQLEEYIGFGPSAHSLFGGRRFFVPPDISEFINSDLQKTETEDASPDFLFEYVMLGLRLCKGIQLDRLGPALPKILRAAKPFEAAGLLKISENNLSLTREGFLVSNGIIGALTEVLEK